MTGSGSGRLSPLGTLLIKRIHKSAVTARATAATRYEIPRVGNIVLNAWATTMATHDAA